MCTHTVILAFSARKQKIIDGVVRLVPTPRYFPLRFHCVELLQQLAASAETYIPTCPLLLDVLEWGDLKRKPKSTTDKPPRLELLVKVPAAIVATRVVQETIINRAFELVRDDFDIYKHNIALPELVVPAAAALRRFAKDSKVTRWQGMAKALADGLRKRGDAISAQRSSSELTPSSANAFETFRRPDEPSAEARRMATLQSRAKAVALAAEGKLAEEDPQTANHMRSRNKAREEKKAAQLKRKQRREDGGAGADATDSTTKGAAKEYEEVVEQASRPKKQRKLSKKDRKMAEKKTREQRAAEKKAKRKPRRPKSAKDGDADAGEDHIEPMNWSDGE